MKKLLALVLVLTFASVSFGTIAKLNAPASVSPSGTVVVTLTVDALANAISIMRLNDNGPSLAQIGTASGASLNAGWTNPTGRDNGSAWDNNGTPSMLFLNTTTTKKAVAATQVNRGEELPVNAVLWQFNWTAPATPGVYTIAVFDRGQAYPNTSYVQVYENSADFKYAIQSASITVTPEPMTMVLLGLGGLVLRRRNA